MRKSGKVDLTPKMEISEEEIKGQEKCLNKITEIFPQINVKLVNSKKNT